MIARPGRISSSASRESTKAMLSRDRAGSAATNQSEIKVPWSGRGSRYTEEEIAAGVEAMRNSDPQTQGRYPGEFERRFAEYTGSPHAFAVSSCTAALELAALLCRLQPGDEVIAPAHTFAASV